MELNNMNRKEYLLWYRLKKKNKLEVLEEYQEISKQMQNIKSKYKNVDKSNGRPKKYDKINKDIKSFIEIEGLDKTKFYYIKSFYKFNANDALEYIRLLKKKNDLLRR